MGGCHRNPFITLTLVDPVNAAPRRRLWVYLAVLAGAGAVMLSWMVPEQPEPTSPLTQPYQQVSYSSCMSSETPSYGTRSISYNCLN